MGHLRRPSIERSLHTSPQEWFDAPFGLQLPVERHAKERDALAAQIRALPS